MGTASDQQLVQKYIQKNDSKAFEQIYERYVDDVYRFVFSRVGKKEWTEDIVSETFITLITVLGSYKGKSSLKSFITGVAINKIKQFWSKEYKGNEQAFDEEFIICIEEEPPTDSRTEKLLKIVRNILPKLKDSYKLVLTERFINCSSIQETAKVLNLSEANVRVIQNRAIKKATLLANELLHNELVKTREVKQ